MNDLKKRLIDSELGKKSLYKDEYDFSQLFKVSREYTRDEFSKINMFGYDVFNCYEASWLNENSLPQAYILQIIVPFNSKYIVESKSLKLYLNSFNNLKFSDSELLRNTVNNDLKTLLGSDSVIVKVFEIEEYARVYHDKKNNSSYCVDKTDVVIENLSSPDSKLLELDKNGGHAEESFYSNLLRSICPITNQPDFATVVVKYTGEKICKKSFLRYISSFRRHGGFHEKCIEKIYHDIMVNLKPKRLMVEGHYTRRGGIDIVPYRANYEFELGYTRSVRQ